MNTTDRPFLNECAVILIASLTLVLTWLTVAVCALSPTLH